ncbi:MAG: UDP-N-acetylmuramoyl-L-alanyl-D-glutamate--2,6-diaminopimelate ligase, partial [Gammaproteobacteria bacterium]|nr:UDP-N-acetylmuramoyl-L-alanyl-D-glutamate--2,6-diaminopimelate ligase [Gammaproteobacteria bacterium]
MNQRVLCTLGQLLHNLTLGNLPLAKRVSRLEEITVHGIHLDSRKVTAGDLFVALHGSAQHGLSYLDQAIAGGATAVIYDPQGVETTALQASLQQLAATATITLVAVPNLRQLISRIAGRFYHHPSRQLNLIGVTGTNGKSSVSHFIA